MAGRNEIDVLINQKKYTLWAYENAEYMQKLSNFVDNKYKEFSTSTAASKTNSEFLSILVEINLADDYFKLQESVDSLKKEIKDKDNEIYKLKQQLAESKGRLDLANQALEKEKTQKIDADKKIIELKTTLLERGISKDEKSVADSSKIPDGPNIPDYLKKAQNHKK